MKVVVDSNIVFSAILNVNSKIGLILIKSGNLFSFYSVPQLKQEILENKDKILSLAQYTEYDFNEIIALIFHKIEIIDDNLIPQKELFRSEELVKNIDIDDTLFVALTNHLRARLWTGDKVLKKGLEKKGWHRFVSIEELYLKMVKRGK